MLLKISKPCVNLKKLYKKSFKSKNSLIFLKHDVFCAKSIIFRNSVPRLLVYSIYVYYI